MATRIVFLAHLCKNLDRGSSSLPCDSSPGCSDSAAIFPTHCTQRRESVPIIAFRNALLYSSRDPLARALASVLVAHGHRHWFLVCLPVRLDLLRTLVAHGRAGPVRRRHDRFPALRAADGCSGAPASRSAG